MNTKWPKVNRNNSVWVFVRGFFATTANVTNYMSINYIAVGISGKWHKLVTLCWDTNQNNNFKPATLVHLHKLRRENFTMLIGVKVSETEIYYLQVVSGERLR